jgi:hypothetical protein
MSLKNGTANNLLRTQGPTYSIGPVYLGAALDQTSFLSFAHESSVNTTVLKSGNATASVEYVLPTAGPAANDYLLASSTAGVLSWLNAAGTYAPIGSAFVTIGNDGTLTAERALTGTTNQITVTDNGAGSTVVLSTPQNIHAAATPTFSSLRLSASSNQLSLGSALADVIITAPTPALSRTHTIQDLANTTFAMLGGTQTFDGSKTFSAAVTITPTTNQVVLGTTRTVTLTAPTPASSSRTWTIPDISSDGTVMALEGTQTVSGAKTFSADILDTSNTSTAISAQASVNGSNPRIVAINTNSTSNQTRTAFVGALGDNSNNECYVFAGKDSSNNSTEGINAGSLLEFQIGGTLKSSVRSAAPFFHSGVDGDTTNISIRINGPSTTGGNTGTLNNSPTSGDPNEWIQVNINGNNRYIPCWA